MFTFDHYQFTEVINFQMAFMFSVSRKYMYINLTIINCLKSLRKNLQWLQELLHVYLHRFMRKWKLLPSIPGCSFVRPPKEGIRNSNGKGVQEEAISKGVGTDSQGLFFQGLWNKNYCFYWWSYINSYSWMLFSQLTCMI